MIEPDITARANRVVRDSSIPEDKRELANRYVAKHAQDADDLELLLDILGLRSVDQ